MKRAALRLSAALILLCCALTSSAQTTIYTRKARVADFATKVTKIVLTGSQMIDECVMREVEARWYLSPFEFCTAAEFEQLQYNPSYFFLRLLTKESHSDILFISILKGGKTDNATAIDAQYEVNSIPLGSLGDSHGRELVFFPACLEIIQQYIVDAGLRYFSAYKGLYTSYRYIPQLRGRKISMAHDDVPQHLWDNESIFRGDMLLMDTEGVDHLFMEEDPQAVVSYTICPSHPGLGARCYTLLLDAGNHDLLYYNSHPYWFKTMKGFTASELKTISLILNGKNENRKNR